MKSAKKNNRVNISQSVSVSIGNAGVLVGELTFNKQGARENSSFVYDSTWLANPSGFEISPDLDLTPEHHRHRAITPQDSVFHLAFADTAPDAWGRRVIARDRAKRRAVENLPPLTEMDYLLAVDDFSRMGALRLMDANGKYLRSTGEGRRHTPPLVDLQLMYDASRAVEQNKESESDLRYLQGKGTSLGGFRPKCTVIDKNGRLSLGKFPSVADERAVTRAEVLALHLAKLAGIDVAKSRIEDVKKVPVAIIERFDRTEDDRRIPYLSAASMLQASRNEERSYIEIADIIRARCVDPDSDTKQLWRRLVFNLLITNVDDHLHNLGFLHVENTMWRLAPAFDINPFPDKERESKTWLSEDSGPITDITDLFVKASYFSLGIDQAKAVISEVVSAVSQWKFIAASQAIGMTQSEIRAFVPAFEHDQLTAAIDLVRGF